MNKKSILETKLRKQKLKNFAKSIDGVTDFELIFDSNKEHINISRIDAATNKATPDVEFKYPENWLNAISWFASSIPSKIAFPHPYGFYIIFNISNKEIFAKSLIEANKNMELSVYDECNSMAIALILEENEVICYKFKYP